jgi:hypothetical protein
MRAFNSATRFGRPFSKQKYSQTSRSRSWAIPVVAAGGLTSAAAIWSKDDLSVRGAAFVRGLRTLKAVIEITLDYKLNLPKGSHESEKYKAALAACHK